MSDGTEHDDARLQLEARGYSCVATYPKLSKNVDAIEHWIYQGGPKDPEKQAVLLILFRNEMWDLFVEADVRNDVNRTWARLDQLNTYGKVQE